MSYNVLTFIIGWLIALIVLLGFLALLRYIQYRERMGLLTHGFRPEDLPRRYRNRHILRAGLITSLVGLALTIGLYPLGFLLPPAFTNTPLHLGPWLLPGLIPLGVGAALVISYYLEQTVQTPGSTQNTEDSAQHSHNPRPTKEVAEPRSEPNTEHSDEP
jgi:hypothetical protein